MRKRTRRWGLLFVCVLILAGLGAGVYLRANDHVLYKFTKIEKGTIESTISATGTCNAVVTVQVGSQVSGNIKELYADYNTKVTKGQVVAKIDPEVFKAKVQQATANLDSSKASVENVKAQIEKARADQMSAVAAVKNAQANVAKSKVAVIDGQAKLKARKRLVTEGAVSAEELDTAQATYDSAIAAQDAAESSVQAAMASQRASEAQVKVMQSQQTQAEAQVKQLEAGLSQAQLDLDHCEIHAPVDGVVVARSMDVGQTIAASFQAPTLFEIAQDLTKMQVDTNVDEADIGKVQVGQKATFTVDAYPESRFRGDVVEIRKKALNTQNVISYDVVIAVSNPDFKLFPGMTANVRILTDRHDDVLKIVNVALRYRPPEEKGPGETPTQKAPTSPSFGGGFPGGGFGGGPRGPRGEGGGGGGGAGGRRGAANRTQKLWRVGPEGKPVAVEVKVGISDGTYTEVTAEDLHESDEIIIGNTTKDAAAAAAGAQARTSRRVGF